MPVTSQTLTDAEEAYHALLTGKSVASFRDSNGEQVTYSAVNVSRLGTYIEDLKRELGLLPTTQGVGPMRVWF
jgi:hypothetical protein